MLVHNRDYIGSTQNPKAGSFCISRDSSLAIRLRLSGLMFLVDMERLPCICLAQATIQIQEDLRWSVRCWDSEGPRDFKQVLTTQSTGLPSATTPTACLASGLLAPVQPALRVPAPVWQVNYVLWHLLGSCVWDCAFHVMLGSWGWVFTDLIGCFMGELPWPWDLAGDPVP